MNHPERRVGQSEIEAQLTELRRDCSDLQESIAERMDSIDQRMLAMESGISGLLEAWNTGRGVVSFIKWSAGLAAAIATLTACYTADLQALVHAIRGDK